MSNSTREYLSTLKPNEGFIEIKPSNSSEWAGICDKNFGKNNADVICRMLGYSYGFEIRGYFGNGRIWLEELSCTGNEDSILECNHEGFGIHMHGYTSPNHRSGYHNWAGVTCKE